MLNLALHGGEDYELLFTVPPSRASKIRAEFRGVALHCIGEIRTARKVTLIGLDGKRRPLLPGGYDHFRKKSPRASRRLTKH